MDSDRTIWTFVLSGVGFPLVLFGCTLIICSDPQLVRDMLLSDWQFLSEGQRESALRIADATEDGLGKPGVATIVSTANAWLGTRSRFLLDATVLLVAMSIADRRVPVVETLRIISRSSWLLVCGEIVDTVMRIGTRRLYGVSAASFFLRPFDSGNPMHSAALSMNVFVVSYICVVTRGLARVQGNSWGVVLLLGCMCYSILVLLSLTEVGEFMVLP